MARLHRFVRVRGWLMVVPLVPLVLLAGCRSSSNSQNSGGGGGGCCGGGGGGGCCRETTPNNPPAVAARSTSTAVDSASALAASRSDSVAANASPSPSAPAQGLYGGQKLCPVTGHELGSMGAPIPVNVKGQTVYVCCRGCVAKVQRDPDGYLRKVQTERGEPSHGTL